MFEGVFNQHTYFQKYYKSGYAYIIAKVKHFAGSLFCRLTDLIKCNPLQLDSFIIDWTGIYSTDDDYRFFFFYVVPNSLPPYINRSCHLVTLFHRDPDAAWWRFWPHLFNPPCLEVLLLAVEVADPSSPSPLVQYQYIIILLLYYTVIILYCYRN